MISKDFDDDVNGLIVGDVVMTGILYYQERPQSQQFYAKDRDSLLKIAMDRKKELIQENPLIYSTDEWTMRIL